MRQFLHTDPVAPSSVFGCGRKALGAVVDPLGDVRAYLRAAREAGMPIRYVRDPHLQADHMSAGRVPAKMAEAEHVFFADARVTFPFHAIREGDVLGLGNITVKVLPMPGHTPEHISLLITDHTRSEEACFVLTGHTLKVGDLNRTELSTSAQEGARELFASMQRLKALPDHLEVMLGAYSGSVCGWSLSGKPTSTIGFEMRYNKAFRIDDEAIVLQTILVDIPPAPPRAAQVRAFNSGLMVAE